MAKSKPTRHVGSWQSDSLAWKPYRKVIEISTEPGATADVVTVTTRYLVESFDETNDEHVQSWEKQQYGW